MITYNTIIKNKRLIEYEECKEAVIATSAATKRVNSLAKVKDPTVDGKLFDYY